MNAKATAIGIVAVLIPFLASAAFACSCGAPTDYSFTRSDIVFLGRLVSSEWRDVKDGRERTAIFAVEQVLKGTMRDRIAVRTFVHKLAGPNVCGIGVTPGRPVVVLADLDLSGRINAGNCSISTRFERGVHYGPDWNKLERLSFDRAVARYRDRLDELGRGALPLDQRLAARAAWLDVTGDVQAAAAAYTDLSRLRADSMYSLRSATEFYWRQWHRARSREQREALELTEAEEAITRSSTDPVPAIVKAVFLDGFDRFAEAADAYAAVIQLVPDQWYWHVLKARVQLQAGQTDAARRTVDGALSLAADQPLVQSLVPLVGLQPRPSADTAKPALPFSKLQTVTMAGAMADGLDLSHVVIQDGNFILASLRQAKFRSAWIRRASFTGADLTGADFSDSLMIVMPNVIEQYESYANFDRAKLNGAIFRRAIVRSGHFVNADLTEIDARDITMEYAVFANSRLVGAHFDGASLGGARIENSDLAGAQLVNASLGGTVIFRSSLRGTNFARSYLAGASIGFSDIDGASFEGAIYDCETKIERRVEIYPHLQVIEPESLGMIAAEAQCDGKNLKRDYSGRKLGGPRLRSAALAGAVLQDTFFFNVQVACLNLAGADLRGADFSQTPTGHCEPRRDLVERALYDARTKWPPHWGAFDPAAYGMIKR